MRASCSPSFTAAMGRPQIISIRYLFWYGALQTLVLCNAYPMPQSWSSGSQNLNPGFSATNGVSQPQMSGYTGGNPSNGNWNQFPNGMYQPQQQPSIQNSWGMYQPQQQPPTQNSWGMYRPQSSNNWGMSQISPSGTWGYNQGQPQNPWSSNLMYNSPNGWNSPGGTGMQGQGGSGNNPGYNSNQGNLPGFQRNPPSWQIPNSGWNNGGSGWNNGASGGGQQGSWVYPGGGGRSLDTTPPSPKGKE